MQRLALSGRGLLCSGKKWLDIGGNYAGRERVDGRRQAICHLAKMAEETNIDKVTGDAWPKLLSPRERQIAKMIARGLSNKDVARKLGLSDGTVKLHVHRILRKLGAKSRHSLIVQAGIRSFHK